MDNLSVLLHQLEENVRKLTEQNNSLKQEITQLNLKKDELEERISGAVVRIAELEDKNLKLKVANSIGAENGKNTDAKLKINELVREIDKCVALLNR